MYSRTIQLEEAARRVLDSANAEVTKSETEQVKERELLVRCKENEAEASSGSRLRTEMPSVILAEVNSGTVSANDVETSKYGMTSMLDGLIETLTY